MSICGAEDVINTLLTLAVQLCFMVIILSTITVPSLFLFDRSCVSIKYLNKENNYIYLEFHYTLYFQIYLHGIQ